MKDIAPEIKRQRLLIEGFYQIDVDKDKIKDFFVKLSLNLNLRIYGEPIIFSPGGEGKGINQGYDAFVPLIDSGISLYVWSNAKFFSTIIYTCKEFDERKAVKFTGDFFNAREMVHKSI